MDENNVQQIDKVETRHRSNSVANLDKHMQLPEAGLQKDFKARTEEDKNKNTVDAKLNITVPASYIDSAGFATAFNTQIGSKKRSFKKGSAILGSRLYKKAQNASRLKEVLKQVVPIEMISLDEFLAIDLSDMKLTTDEEFVESAPRLFKLKGIMRIMQFMIPEELANNKTLSEEKKEKIKNKLEFVTRLVGYFDARSTLITHSYYVTHYNSELSYMENRVSKLPPADPAQDTRSKKEKAFDLKIAEQEEVSNLILGVEYATFLLKNGSRPTEETKPLFDELYKKKLSAKKRLGALDSFSVRNKMEDGPSGGIGYFLQFMNWMTRRKRRTTYGEPEYDTAVRKLQQLPEEIRNYRRDVPIKKNLGIAPDIDLNKYIQDPIKDSLKMMYTLAPVPTEADGDYKLAYEALGNWTTVRGIVNLDTVRMEMSFSDRFLKASKRWLAAHPEAKDAKDVLLQARYKMLTDANKLIEDKMYGGLKNSMTAEEFDRIVKNSQIISEDNTYGKNVEESNTKDIPLFLHKPGINDVKQAFVGNCWLHGCISSLVAKNPDAIENMFCDLKDGSVMVRLFRFKDKNGEAALDMDYVAAHKEEFTAEPAYFRIRKDFEEENGNANDCLWVQLLERAVAVNGVSGSFLANLKDGKLSNMAAELTNGGMALGMALLTGELWEETETVPKEKEKKKKGGREKFEKTLTKYFYYLSGLPWDLKQQITGELGSKLKKGDQIDLEYIINEAKNQQEGYRFQRNTILEAYDQLILEGDALERTGELKDLDKFEFYKHQIDTALGMDYANQDVEKLIRENAEKIKNGQLPELKGGDQTAFKGFGSGLHMTIINLQMAIASGDKKTLLKEANEMFKRITDAFNAGGSKGQTLKTFLKKAEKTQFEGEEFEEKDAVIGNLRTAFRMEYGQTTYEKKKEDVLIKLLYNLKKNGPYVAGFGMHCLTVLDVQRKGDRWFVLIRDPFNLYNRTYTEKKGKLSCKSEGFFRIFNYNLYTRKRHLTDRGDASNMRAGFRGLSWWTFDDVYKECILYSAK